MSPQWVTSDPIITNDGKWLVWILPTLSPCINININIWRFFFFLFNNWNYTWHAILFFLIPKHTLSVNQNLSQRCSQHECICKQFIITNKAAISIPTHEPFYACALSSILPSLWPACVWAPVYGGCCGWTPGGWAAEEEEAMLSGVPDRSSAGALGGPGWS